MSDRDKRKKAKAIVKANVKRSQQTLMNADDSISRHKAKKISRISHSDKDREKKSEYSEKIHKASIKVAQGKGKPKKKTGGYKITRKDKDGNPKTYTGTVNDEQWRRLNPREYVGKKR